MNEETNVMGQHYIVDLKQCDPDKLKDVLTVRAIVIRAVDLSQATVIKSVFHQFEPDGVTGVVLIAESHFAIHTWPEKHYVSLDILTCGAMDAQRAIDEMIRAFGAQFHQQNVLTRMS